MQQVLAGSDLFGGLSPEHLKEIEKIAISRGHEISLKIDINNPEDLTITNLKKSVATYVSLNRLS